MIDYQYVQFLQCETCIHACRCTCIKVYLKYEAFELHIYVPAYLDTREWEGGQ